MSSSSTELAGPWDLVVVGHGFAGMTSAKSFLDEAAAAGREVRVAVLERTPPEEKGGSTWWTSAILRLTGESELDPSWETNVRKNAGRLANDEYISTFYANVRSTLEWLTTNGVQFDRLPMPMSPTGYMWSVHEGGKSVVNALLPRIQAAGGRVFYETTAERLVREEGGAVTGIVVRTAGGESVTMQSKAVVLACGGFEGNPELLTRYIPDSYRLKTVSPGTMSNQGDGIRMAVEVGAATAGQYDGAHIEPCDARSDGVEPLVAAWYWGILVNRNAERFMDEAETTYDVQFDSVANRTHREQGGRSFAIIDQSVRRAVPFLDGFQATALPGERADTIEELAEKLGLDPVVLRRTVDEYNAAAPGDIDPTTLDGRATVGVTPRKSNYAQPLTEGPFEAWPIQPQICFTYGGLRVDGHSHVVDSAGRAIPGLYAAGEIAGIFYKEYPSGSSGLRSMTFGREAGRAAAAETVQALETREHELVDAG